MSKGIKKKIFRNNLKDERHEIKDFDKDFAQLYRDFNAYLFDSAPGSFNEFDVRYRALANKKYKFLNLDPEDFTNYAIAI